MFKYIKKWKDGIIENIISNILWWIGGVIIGTPSILIIIKYFKIILLFIMKPIVLSLIIGGLFVLLIQFIIKLIKKKNKKIKLIYLIENELYSDKKLSEILLKIKNIAYKLNNTEFSNYINLEINGYYGNDAKFIPDYRKIPSIINCDYNNGLNIIYNKKLPIDYLNLNTDIDINFSISDIENYITQGHLHGHISLTKPINDSFCDKLNEIGNYNVYIIKIYNVFNISSLESITNAVKNKLLDFLLKLKDDNEKN